MHPELLHFRGFTLPTYGLLVATGVLVGLLVTVRMARRRGIDPVGQHGGKVRVRAREGKLDPILRGEG